MQLSDKYPFLINYFKKGISNKLKNKGVPIAHSLLFYGQDLSSQYNIALEIARLLNCDKDGEENCECLNCKWIREGKHPAVLTISRLDNKPSDDETKTVISIKQSEMIKKTLMTTSDFFRVFIFCDKDENGNIKGLNDKNFQEETANSMLKIIEEPNDKVLFIFLTSNKEDVLPTIISRSQCFNVSQTDSVDFSYNSIKSVFLEYWNFERNEVFNIANDLYLLSKNITPQKLLIEIQNYILDVLKNNPQDVYFINDLKEVEKAYKEIELGINPQNVFECLCLKLIK